MGLFSTLASSGQPETSLSSNIATVVQLYTNRPIELDTSTAKVTGYTAMTFQAVQVGISADEMQEPKNKHQNPDLGIWNCCVHKSGTTEEPLVDHLLSKVAKNVPTFCWTIDLSDESKVEPTVNILQEALVRHLIEKSSISSSSTTTTTDSTSTDENTNPDDQQDGGQQKNDQQQSNRTTATTSLYDLRSLQFGLASEDKTSTTAKKNAAPSNIEKEVKTTLMICAVMPSLYNNQEVSEVAYRKKLARALTIYHLRRFANALNASLCFVSPPNEDGSTPATTTTTTSGAPTDKPTEDAQQQQQQQQIEQPTVSLDKLAQLWRDLAMDKEVWKGEEEKDLTTTNSGEEGGEESKQGEEEGTTTGGGAAVTVHSTAIYGPGHHQSELIETVLLRDANYPGNWDSSKDSLWVALPIADDTPPEATTMTAGDEGWLTQLRNSIASADLPKKAATPDKPSEEKPKEKDAAVSSFFESLLKNP